MKAIVQPYHSLAQGPTLNQGGIACWFVNRQHGPSAAQSNRKNHQHHFIHQPGIHELGGKIPAAAQQDALLSSVQLNVVMELSNLTTHKSNVRSRNSLKLLMGKYPRRKSSVRPRIRRPYKGAVGFSPHRHRPKTSGDTTSLSASLSTRPAELPQQLPRMLRVGNKPVQRRSNEIDSPGHAAHASPTYVLRPTEYLGRSAGWPQ